MDRTDRVRRGILWASGDFKKEDIADAIGAPRTRLSSFLKKKGDLSTSQIDAAERWLKERAYWGGGSDGTDASAVKTDNNLVNPAMREIDATNPLHSIGLWMVATGQDLQSPFLEADQKIQRLVEFVDQMNKRIKADLAAVEKWKERGN